MQIQLTKAENGYILSLNNVVSAPQLFVFSDSTTLMSFLFNILTSFPEVAPISEAVSN